MTIQFKLKEKFNHWKIGKTLFNDFICEKIIIDNSNWTSTEERNTITFLLKSKWNYLKNTKSVENSKRINEFNNETQTFLNKIFY